MQERAWNSSPSAAAAWCRDRTLSATVRMSGGEGTRKERTGQETGGSGNWIGSGKRNGSARPPFMPAGIHARCWPPTCLPCAAWSSRWRMFRRLAGWWMTAHLHRCCSCCCCTTTSNHANYDIEPPPKKNQKACLFKFILGCICWATAESKFDIALDIVSGTALKISTKDEYLYPISHTGRIMLEDQ